MAELVQASALNEAQLMLGLGFKGLSSRNFVWVPGVCVRFFWLVFGVGGGGGGGWVSIDPVSKTWSIIQ